jgi:hypothetical protein
METTKVKEMEPENSLVDFQKTALETAENDLENLRKEIQTKKYLIDLKKEDIVLLEKFNKLDAPWKFTECLGIVEVEKELALAVKSGKLYIGSIAIEAMYYYMSKVEGTGKNTNTEAFKSVDDYIRVLKSLTLGMERVKADNEKLRQSEFVVAARREGIEPDNSIIEDQKSN